MKYELKLTQFKNLKEACRTLLAFNSKCLNKLDAKSGAETLETLDEVLGLVPKKQLPAAEDLLR